jgi:hypothetical protein
MVAKLLLDPDESLSRFSCPPTHKEDHVKLFSRNLLKIGFVTLLAGASAVVVSCNGTSNSGPTANGGVGSVDLALVEGGVTLNSVSYTITGPNSYMTSGSINVASSATLSAVIGGLPAGNGYTITLSATGTDGTTTCGGSATFNVTAGAVTAVSVTLDCHEVAKTGSVSVNGAINVCPVADGLTANPSTVFVGYPVALTFASHDPDNGPSPLAYSWSAPSGTFTNGTTATPTFVCSVPGQVILTATASDGDPSTSCAATMSVTINCQQTLLVPGSLVVSSTTYDNTQGALATLAVGSPIANTNTATQAAVAGNDYVNVWNNAPVDGSFGVTSEITLSDLNPTTLAVLSTVAVPTNQVVTSFSSKSELALHVTKDASSQDRLVFVAYAGSGVGALDVSNSDSVAGQDLTNPVTYAFDPIGGPYTYAFHRTIVSMDVTGNLVYTPTIAYGGNNGRAALLSSNGLYYSVGNGNNGNAAAFGSSNGTNPDVTENTGVEVVTPINGASSSVAIPAGNSAEVDPLLQFTNGGKLDKPGKDDNFRGIAEFGGALYFTKGSGSNGYQTVYTVPTLPTIANAASQTITVVPGFPTDSAKAALADKTSGGNYTPFAIFFANATTMYVTDEGTGNSTDVTHGGLMKWSLVSGTWQLDYILTTGAIGTVDNLTGSDGAWPAVNTIGLRNMTGVVNGDQVTLWAVTSTKSTSGDNGADPNKVVTITDSLSATTLPAGESFSPVIGPTYGTVYRGVAFVNP